MLTKSIRILSVRYLICSAGIVLTYLLVRQVEYHLALAYPFVTPIWIPAGITVAVFALFGFRMWPAVLIGSFLTQFARIGEISAIIGALGSTLGGFCGTYLLNRFVPVRKAFDTARGVFLFVLFGCICTACVSSTIGVLGIYLGGQIDVNNCGPMWIRWSLANTVGVLLIAPFLILLLRGSHHQFGLMDFGELTALLMGMIFVCFAIFGPLSVSMNTHRIFRPWLCIPFLIWAGFRFCQLEAAGATLLLFGTAIWGTLHKFGPFLSDNLNDSLILLDGFVGVIAAMTLVVAALVVEQRNAREELLRTQAILSETAERKNRDLIVTVQALEMEIAERSSRFAGSSERRHAHTSTSQEREPYLGNERPES
jgi:integral membrane sensor domain MASE1